MSDEINNNITGNTGTIGNITINQSNTNTNDYLKSKKKINEFSHKMLLAQERDSTQEQKLEAQQLAALIGVAHKINEKNITTTAKNAECKVDVSAVAKYLGLELNFAFKKCDEVFN